jgi:hypothetical protein
MSRKRQANATAMPLAATMSALSYFLLHRFF